MMSSAYGLFPSMPSNSSATLLCAHCKKFFSYMDNVIFCEGICKRWFHIKCVKLPENKYRVISEREENRNLGLRCSWACKECKERGDWASGTRDAEFESYVREKLGKLSQVLEFVVNKLQDIEQRHKNHEVEFNKLWQQQQAVSLQSTNIQSPRSSHIYPEYASHHSSHQQHPQTSQTTQQIPVTTQAHIHEVKMKVDSGKGHQQQEEVSGQTHTHTSEGLHLMRPGPLVDPITGQEIDAQEAGDALYTFTSNFSAPSTTQTQTSSTPSLKEAMECHYGDCKCIKQEDGSSSKPCNSKHCNCTCKSHKATKKPKKETVGKMHQCPYCEFTSKRSDNVKRHMLRHTGERPHKCTECDFSAKRPHSLKKHIENVHRNDLRDLRQDGLGLRVDSFVR